MSEEPLPSTDAEEVRKEFLNKESVTAVNSEVPQPIDLAAEAKALLLPPKEDSEEERVDTPLDPLFDTQGPSEINFMAWATKVADVGEVVVSKDEKVLFLKAALNDTDVKLTIRTPISNESLDITCRTLSVDAMDLLFATMNSDEDAGRVKDPSMYATTMQKYAVSMQVLCINDKDYAPFNPDPSKSVDENIIGLREHAATLSGKTNHVRWHYILLALRIFTIKIKLCTDAALNQDFWSTAGTD